MKLTAMACIDGVEHLKMKYDIGIKKLTNTMAYIDGVEHLKMKYDLS